MGYPALGQGNFFLGGIQKHKVILNNDGGTWIGPGQFFSEAGFESISKSLHNIGWGNLDRAGELFSGLDCNDGGTWPGGTFYGAGIRHIKQISTNGRGILPGGTFFGAGFVHIKQISTNSGGTWPGPGGLFFPLSVI